MTQTFVHLRLHSEYSLADGIVRVDDLVQAVRKLEMPAVAVTDLANLFAMVKLYRAAVQAGIKPIVGADVWLENADNPVKPFRLLLLCQNRRGYGHLSRLLTRAYLEGQHSGRPCLNKRWFAGATEGLIALSGALDGDLGQAVLAGNRARVDALAAEYAALFPGRFYVELQRVGQSQEEAYIADVLPVCAHHRLPVVATNQVQFLKADEYEAHEARVCIHDGRVLSDGRRPRRFTDQQYLRSGAEMAALFADVPEALDNTLEIARRCNLQVELGKYYLPDYPLGADERVEQVLRDAANAGLARHLAAMAGAPDAAREAAYRERLELELEVIDKMGFAGYFLIVADFIRWAKENDIPVGPGRGSGAGSLVAWCMGITALDPIAYDLLFERFLNPERVSLPDFDVDFCIEGRDRVIEYVALRYGREKVAQIITHGTMAARAVVRDVGRVLGHPYGFVDRIAKLIPFKPGKDISLTEALAQEEELRKVYEREEEVRALIDLAQPLQGLARSAGTHAAGVVIAPTALTDFMPLYCEQGGTQAVTQLDMKDIEKLGLVKFDFLGLRNLTVIDHAVRTINATRIRDGEEPLVMDAIPLDDAQTYALIKTARTTALFQLESRGIKDLIQRLQPDVFEDIVALVALYRPGPLMSGMVDDFVNRKHGRARIEYPHPALEPILKPTYGVIVYQEQVMQIAQVLAGYSLGGADLLRRAMGKKRPEEMAQQRSVFVEGAHARGVSDRLATYIFDLMEKFAEYGFNRSHSVAYALIAYQTAWLKTHYPAAYMAAVLSGDMDKTDKVVTMIAECRDLGIAVLPPDINRCAHQFVPVGEREILYGLGAIKGIGAAAIEAILEARGSGGPFRDIFDFCERVDARKVNRRVLESLVRAGAMDALGPHRAVLFATLPLAMNAAGQQGKDRDAGQEDLFGVSPVRAVSERFVEVPEWSEDERLEAEKETLGLYLTGHPIVRYQAELEQIVDATLGDLKPTEDRTVVVAGLVVGLRTMQTKRGDRMAFVTLDDRLGRLELAVFADLYAKSRDLLRKDNLLVVEGKVSVDEYSGNFRMSADRIYNIDEARAAFASRLVIDVDAAHAGNGFLDELQAILRPHARGQCAVVVRYDTGRAEAELVLGEQWRILPNAEVLDHLSQLAGGDAVRLIYARPETRRSESGPARAPGRRERNLV